MCKCKCRIAKALGKLLLKLLAVALGFFAVTFTMYIFNLDMKLTAAIEPWLLKHYDKVPRDRHL